MKIKNHRFDEYWYKKSADVGGGIEPPKLIVLHYTAGGTTESTRDYMMLSPIQKQRRISASKKVYGSAHLLVGRDGLTFQIVPFNLKARHAGVSNWKGMRSLNQYSIGIEIANYGWLDQQMDGSYCRSGETPVFSADEVYSASMPGGDEIKGWECYPEKQLLQVEKLGSALLDHYPSIIDIVRHQDVSPGRKFDPGPAFPMARFKRLMDKNSSRGDEGEDADVFPLYQTTARLNIRGGPGVGFDKLHASPLEKNTHVMELSQLEDWSLVRPKDNEKEEGWVYNRYLAPLD